jgi:hypothetical protein
MGKEVFVFIKEHSFSPGNTLGEILFLEVNTIWKKEVGK